MSAEKIFLGAVLAVGAIVLASSEQDAASSVPERTDPPRSRPAVAASEIRSEADLQRRASAPECPSDSIGYWGTDKVAQLARCMSAAAPVRYDDGTVLTAARSEGRTLILELRHPESLTGYVADRQAGAAALCGMAMVRDLVGRGVGVRLALSGSDGSTIPPLQVDRCA